MPLIIRLTSKDGVRLSDDSYSVTVLPDAITVDDDGPADFSSIQAAADAATDGDTILVAAGTYVEHVEISKNIHLLGAGRDATRIEFAGENPTVLVTDSTAGSIQGFTLAYTGPETDDDFRCALWVRASTAVVSANRMTGTGFGIRCTNGSSVEIAGNLIDENRRSGMILRESNAQISSNIVRDNGENGISTTDGTRITQFRDNQILGNGGTGEDGIAMTATVVETIENNIFKGNGRGGMIGFRGTQIILIRDNQILANDRLGIALMGATIETIENNTIKDNSVEGIITFEGSQITLIQNNQILANGNDGMQFQGTTVETIQNNTIQNNKRYGIFPLSGSQVTRIQGNQIVANVNSGIPMSGAAVETIQSNFIKDNQGSGVSTWGSDNQITRLQDNQIIANSDRGIFLEGVTVETLQSNVIKDNGSSGIQTWEGSQITQIQGNEIVANKTDVHPREFGLKSLGTYIRAGFSVSKRSQAIEAQSPMFSASSPKSPDYTRKPKNRHKRSPQPILSQIHRGEHPIKEELNWAERRRSGLYKITPSKTVRLGFIPGAAKSPRFKTMRLQRMRLEFNSKKRP